MKIPSVFFAITLFTLGFVLVNGHHNFLSVLFVGILITLFMVIPLLIKIRHFIKDISRYSLIRRKQWA